MKEVKAYETSDGKIFSDQGEALLHQSNLDNAGSISDFLASEMNEYKAGAARSISIRAIQAWQRWNATPADDSEHQAA